MERLVRALGHSIARRPSPVGGGAADVPFDIRIGFPLWLRPFVFDGVAAITLGRRVYLDPSVDELGLDRLTAILHHEITHVNQYRRHGLAAFLARYLLEYLQNRWRGLTSEEAYREISFEREAFAEERRIERDGNDV